MPSGVSDVKPAATASVNKAITTSPVQMDANENKTLKNSDSRPADEGIEVVLENSTGSTTVVDSPERPDQSIFRHPQALRPRAVRAPGGPPPPPPHGPHPGYVHGSGSWGYHHGEYPHHAPPPPPPPPRSYPHPSVAGSHNPPGSFDDQASYHHHTPHYSPHVQYPPHRHPVEDVNVISPNHKEDPRYRPPVTPRARQPYYQYPPTSPVSRPAGAPSSGPPRLRQYASMRRGEGAYARAQRDSYERWGQRSQQPPVVADSFDSERPANTTSAPPPPPPSTSGHDPYHQFYGPGSWGSFDSAAGHPPPPPPPHFDDQRYYGYPPPDSPFSQSYAPPYSPGGIYPAESFPGPYTHAPPSFSYSYDEEDRFMQHQQQDYGEDRPKQHVTPPGNARAKSSTPVASNTTADRDLLLPKAAEEIDFDVTDPPAEPVTPPSDQAIYESLADVNGYDVLCGRGGGTNSQIGNRRFRKLVQEFQPTYLMAKRKEKPLLARTIVLIIRKRGGHFLKKNEDTGELFEVGDTKAEAKTSQALREGLDVRATRSAQVGDKKKKKKNPKSPLTPNSMETSPTVSPNSAAKPATPKSRNTKDESPPTLPRLQGEETQAGMVHPHSPDQSTFRKRRRMRSTDRFFPDFCPPRADLNRPGSPSLADADDDDDHILHPDNVTYDNESVPARGCAGIAMDLVTGAATGSFCLGPTGWRR